MLKNIYTHTIMFRKSRVIINIKDQFVCKSSINSLLFSISVFMFCRKINNDNIDINEKNAIRICLQKFL